MANDGEVALRMVEENLDSFSLIFMDIQMPNMDVLVSLLCELF